MFQNAGLNQGEPEFMLPPRAVAIAGLPRLAPYDLPHRQTQIDAIKNDRLWNNGDYTENPARAFEYEIGAMILTTLDFFNAHTTRERVLAEIAKSRDHCTGPDANNKTRQVKRSLRFGSTITQPDPASKGE